MFVNRGGWRGGRWVLRGITRAAYSTVSSTCSPYYRPHCILLDPKPFCNNNSSSRRIQERAQQQCSLRNNPNWAQAFSCSLPHELTTWPGNQQDAKKAFLHIIGLQAELIGQCALFFSPQMQTQVLENFFLGLETNFMGKVYPKTVNFAKAESIGQLMVL